MEIWKKPCKNCPSAHFPPDPEAADIEKWFKAGEIGLDYAVFTCAWRPGKLCKGVCDRMGLTEEDVVDYERPKIPEDLRVGKFNTTKK